MRDTLSLPLQVPRPGYGENPSVRISSMATIFRVRDFRVVIYSNDHRPPHCHVIGPRGAAKVAFGEGPLRPWVMNGSGLSRRRLTEALRVVSEHRDLLLARWSEIHGK